MKGLSIFILAGAVIAGAGAVAYKLYKDKKAEKELAEAEEPIVYEEGDIPEDLFEDDTAEDLTAEESAEKPDEE